MGLNQRVKTAKNLLRCKEGGKNGLKAPRKVRPETLGGGSKLLRRKCAGNGLQRTRSSAKGLKGRGRGKDWEIGQRIKRQGQGQGLGYWAKG